jgi:hypothetical protein
VSTYPCVDHRMFHFSPGSHYTALAFVTTYYAREWGFERWACLDSNQGPLPYQRNGPMSAPYRCVRNTGLDRAFLTFCRRTLVRWIPRDVVPVGVSVGVKPVGHCTCSSAKARPSSSLRFSFVKQWD